MKKHAKKKGYEFDGAFNNIMNGKMEKSDGKYEFDGAYHKMAHKKPNDILSAKD
jgi:hypothetical protein